MKSLKENPPEPVNSETVEARIIELGLRASKRELVISQVQRVLDSCPSTSGLEPSAKRRFVQDFAGDQTLKELLA
jgi:hypothetical protein